MTPRQFADGGKIGGADDGAAGIIRGGEENRAGSRRNRRLERRKIHSKPAGGRRRHTHHACAGDLERGGICRVQGLERDHLVAGTRQTQRCDEQGVLRSGEEDHVGRFDGLARALTMRASDGLAQRIATRHRRVVRIAGPQGFYRALEHGLRRVEIGVADAQYDDVLAAILRRARLIVYLPRIGSVAGDTIHQI